jgi:ATP-dependent RNA helicase DDX10/DBP4
MRSIYLHKDKAIFKLAELPAERFAQSLGLPGAPKIKFLNKELTKQKSASRSVAAAHAEITKEDGEVSGSEYGEMEVVETESSSEEEDAHTAITPAKPFKVCSPVFLESGVLRHL